MNRKQTEECLEESARLFEALRLSVSELKRLIEEGPNKTWKEDK